MGPLQTVRTVAVVPARNEAATLQRTLEALGTLRGLGRIVVADDASTDSTPTVASGLGAEVARSSGAWGKGGALLEGLRIARASSPEAYLLCDADLGDSAAGLGALLAGLSAERPATIAAFPKSAASGGGFGLVKRFAAWEIRRRAGFSPVEPLSGQRALLASALEELPGLAPGFGAEVGMTLDLLRGGITPFEIPVDLSHRATGRGFAGFAHRARQGRDVLRALRGERLAF